MRTRLTGATAKSSDSQPDLATNTWSTGPAAGVNEARLLEWELLVPSEPDVESVAHSLRISGYSVEKTANGVAAADPSATRVQVRLSV